MKVAEKMVLDIARGEIGYMEKESCDQLDSKTANAGDENFTKYARDLADAGYYQASKQGCAYCDVGVDWSFFKAAGGDKEKAEYVQCQSGPYGAGVDWSRSYYKDAGRLDRNPKVGDQVFFGEDGSGIPDFWKRSEAIPWLLLSLTGITRCAAATTTRTIPTLIRSATPGMMQPKRNLHTAMCFPANGSMTT